MFRITTGRWSFTTLFQDSKALKVDELEQPMRDQTYGVAYELVDAIQRRGQKGKKVLKGGTITAPVVCPCAVRSSEAIIKWSSRMFLVVGSRSTAGLTKRHSS